MKGTICWMGRLSILALVVGFAGEAAAQTWGTTVDDFNILANTQITLTGVASAPVVVPEAGISPGAGPATLTNASITTAHYNDAKAATALTEAGTLDTSLNGALTNDLGVITTFTSPILIGPGVNRVEMTGLGDITNTDATINVTGGDPTSIVIFRLPGALTLTRTNIIFTGGVLAGNVYWQVKNDVAITNGGAIPMTMPGTIISQTGDITVSSLGASDLNIARLISLTKGVTMTQSGGILTIQNPTTGGGAGPVVPGPAVTSCDEYFYPAPATGATGKFHYCMTSAGTARIRVYNAIGDLAATVVESKAAGVNESTLNTARMAPGVYLYLLQKEYDNGGSSISKTKKFVVRH